MFESVVANQVIGAMKADPVPGGGGGPRENPWNTSHFSQFLKGQSQWANYYTFHIGATIENASWKVARNH